MAVSPCEAEYMALTSAVSESRWLSQLLNEISPSLCEDVVIFEDNKSTIAVANNNKLTPRMKHVDIKYHFVQNYVQDGLLRILYIRTGDMVADALTKHLGSNLVGKHSKSMFG